MRRQRIPHPRPQQRHRSAGAHTEASTTHCTRRQVSTLQGHRTRVNVGMPSSVVTWDERDSDVCRTAAWTPDPCASSDTAAFPHASRVPLVVTTGASVSQGASGLLGGEGG
jgi:hypothetical protein